LKVLTTAKTLAEAFADICFMDAPMAVKLDAYAAKLRELNFPYAEAYDELVGRLYSGGVGTTAPEVGETMPDFILPARSGNLVALADLTTDGPVVVSFNRGHWCPFCKIELKALAETHQEIVASGAQVVTIMPDRQQFAANIEALTGDSIRILTDIDNGYALSLGLAIWVGERVKALMKGRGFHLDTYHGSDGWYLPVPATFVVDRAGRVRARFVDPEFRRRMEVGEILAALAGMQETARKTL
jgi:peroxiredoxin